jgi:hypothetical protein
VARDAESRSPFPETLAYGGVFLWADRKSPAELAAMYPTLAPEDIEAALAFYAERREEIDRLLLWMRDLFAEFRRRAPAVTLSDPYYQALMEAVLDRFEPHPSTEEAPSADRPVEAARTDAARK